MIEIGKTNRSKLRVLSTFVFGLLVTSACIHTSEQEEKSGKQIYNEALTLFKDKFIRRHDIDWNDLDRRAREFIPPGQDPQSAIPPIEMLISIAGERHTFLVKGTSKTGGRTDPDSAPRAEVRFKDGIPIIEVPFMVVEIKSHVEIARNTLTHAIETSKCGLVVDLSHNSGGNMWPMLKILEPALPNQVLGYFIDADGEAEPWGVSPSGVYLGKGAVSEQRANSIYRGPVAVLTGSRTTSSGEAVTIAFRSRPHTRLFGTRTGGFATANRTFTLHDNIHLTLTNAYMADINKTTYPLGITPDKNSSAPLNEALAWLKSQCSRD